MEGRHAVSSGGDRKRILTMQSRPIIRALPLAVPTFLAAFFLFQSPTRSQTPVCSAAQYEMANQGCYYPPTALADNCPGNGVTTSNLQTESINQFYTYGASGVSVLYCGGNSGSVTSSDNATLTMQCVPPPNATIVAAFAEVVEYFYCETCCDNSPMGFSGTMLPAGTRVGRTNYMNDWFDPRYGPDVQGGNWQVYFCDIRYSVPVSLVSGGASSYALTNLPSFAISDSLVIVYTVPAPGVCSAVALGDGLYTWDDSDTQVLNYGITPSGSTLDWSCAQPDLLSCNSSAFSVFGGSDNTGAVPANFNDQFLSAPSGGATLASSHDCGFDDACGTATQGTDFSFETTYSPIPAFSGPDRVTWALGNALAASKENFWVNLMAASCAGACVSPTPTGTPTSTFTATSSPTSTPTPTGTWFTPTPTDTATSTSTSSATATASFSPTATASSTPTNSRTPTSTRTASPTATPTGTAPDTATATAVSTATLTGTFTLTFTTTSTATLSATGTLSSTATVTATPTFTPSGTATSTATSSFTATRSATSTFTSTLTGTPTFTSSPTLTGTATSTPTETPSFTPSLTTTPTLTPTSTATSTVTSTLTASPSATPSGTPTWTATRTSTMTVSDTPTVTDSFTPSSTPTRTFTVTATPTVTDSPTRTPSATPTSTPSPPATATLTSTPTLSPPPSLTPTITLTFTPTATVIPAPVALRIGVYNGAGELIKTLLVTSVSVPVESLQLSSSVETSLESVISVYVQGRL